MLIPFPVAFLVATLFCDLAFWGPYPTGYKVVRVRFENGEPAGVEDFLTGFLSEDGKSEFGRVAGRAFTPDGELLVSEDTNGVIYKITHQAGG